MEKTLSKILSRIFPTFGDSDNNDTLANCQEATEIKSLQFVDGSFKNTDRTPVFYTKRTPIKIIYKMARKYVFKKEKRVNAKHLPIIRLNALDFKKEKPIETTITWLGHASSLIETNGIKIITDPIFSKKASPFMIAGPSRMHQFPLDISKGLPCIDVALISHDHYDHLDMASVKTLSKKDTIFIVPLGVGSHLLLWGVNKNKIIELDWWESYEINGTVFTATPSRHFSGRQPFVSLGNKTLWSSWAIKSADKNIFFSGDTGYTEEFKEIGNKLGPFDISLMSIGAYSDTWPAIHMTPEEAVQAHSDINGDLFLPIHWATFRLAFHAWHEPAERLHQIAKEKNINYYIQKPGEIIKRNEIPPLDKWWRKITLETPENNVSKIIRNKQILSYGVNR